MTMFGLVENNKGVSFPLIRDGFNVPFEMQGFMVAMLSLAYVASNIIAGIFLGRFGIKPAVFAGYSAIVMGTALVFFTPGFLSTTAALFVLFGGFGFLDIGMNALASKVFVANAALLMNLLHSFYGIGSIIAPGAAGFVVNSTNFDWRFAYLFSLPIVLLLIVLAIVTRFPKDEGGITENVVGASAAVERGGFFDAVKNPMVWRLALALGLALIIESKTANWGPLYFQDVHGIDPATEGAIFLSAFFLLFTISRLVCGPFIERIGYVKSLLGVTCMALVVLIVGFSMGAKGIFVLPALGFLVALFWPTLMAVAIVCFGKNAPVYGGATIALAGLVNTAGQFLVGLTNRVIGPAWGYRSSIVYTVLMIFSLLLLYKNLKRRKVRKI